MIRAVLDANVLVSALVSPNGVPGRILSASERGRFEFVVSERLVAELEDVLARGKFRRYATVEQAGAHVRRVRAVGVSASEGDIEPVSPDPKDDYLVALARAAEADFLVSGDPHLLGLTLDDLPVVAPRTFLEITEQHG